VNKETLAYMACFIDCEGTIEIQVSKPKIGGKHSHTSPHHYLRVTGSNTCKELIDWAVTNFGGRFSKPRVGKKSRRLIWEWTINSNQAGEFLRSISPYLIVKRRHCELALEFLEIKQLGRKGRTPSSYELRMREHYKREISNLRKLYSPNRAR
jgi:hypothetical protein